MKKMILFVLIIIVFNGCLGTANTFYQPKLYSATRGTVSMFIEAPYYGGENTLATTIWLIDLPFSLVFDTILIPYKTYLIINEENNKTISKNKYK